MSKKKSILIFMGKIFLSIIVIAVAVTIPLLKFVSNEDNLDKTFFGEKAEYQGVIELWHIETFEGGTTSRARWLEKRAIEFENKFKGLYVLIKSMDLTGLENALANGQCPDLFSFSKGAEELIKDKLSNLQFNSLNISNVSLFESGKVGDSLLAVPYCYSAYVLISSTQNLSNYENYNNESLAQLLYKTGYVKKLKKSEKNIYSCVYGGAGRTSPIKNINALGLTADELSFTNKVNEMSGYDAYCDFVAGNANILVGTLRDLARIENKVSVGAWQDAIIEPFSKQTDMVCYLSATDFNGELRKRYANEFISFCLNESSQQKIAEMGLLSVTNNNIYSSGAINVVEKYINDEVSCPKLFE